MMYYLIIDLERTIAYGKKTYWKPYEIGYTDDIQEAGIYPSDVAIKISLDDYNKKTVLEPCSY